MVFLLIPIGAYAQTLEGSASTSSESVVAPRDIFSLGVVTSILSQSQVHDDILVQRTGGSQKRENSIELFMSGLTMRRGYMP